MRPLLTLAGFIARTPLAPSDVDLVEKKQPGYTAEQIFIEQEALNARLLKRYAVPFATTMGPPTADGTTPPVVVYGNPPVYGSPVSGDLVMLLKLRAPGPTSTATFDWSKDNGQTWIENVPTAPTVALAGTGLTVLFPAIGSFSVDNVYKSATPCPRKVLEWLVNLVSLSVYERRGYNATNDDFVKQRVAAAERARAESKEAADSKDGLFDLPLNADAATTAIVTPQPLGCGMSSPYEWMDHQRRRGRREDAR